MLLSTAYFPPIEYFALLARYSVVYIEACENYCKQSWRNRCRILSANGPLDLNVPVVHEGGSFRIPIKRIRVEYTTPWVVRTERAIESAYSSAPYFGHYRDGVFAILDSHPDTLWNLNMRIIRYFCEKFGIGTEIRETISFVGEGWVFPPQAGLSEALPASGPLPLQPGAAMASGGSTHPSLPRVAGVSAGKPGAADYRYSLHPKKENTIMRDLGLERPYWQVFGERFGFTPGLSVLDLLFNEGPDSPEYLR